MVLLLPIFDVEYGLWGRYIGIDRGGLRMLHDMVVASGGIPADGSSSYKYFSTALKVRPEMKLWQSQTEGQ